MIKNFYRPADAEEALELHARGGIFLAGGTEINRGWTGAGDLPGVPGEGPDIDAVYLYGLGLNGFRDEGGSLLIGACTTLQEIIDEPGIPDWLKKAAAFIPSRNIRNMATIGGNIAAGRANSVLLPVLLASGGVIHTADRGTLTVEKYLENPRGLILEVELPGKSFLGVCRTVKEARSHLAVPVVTAGVYMEISGKTVSHVRIAAGCGCAGPVPGRLRTLEEKLAGSILPPREELITLVAGEVNPTTDIFGSAEYRSRVNGVRIADLLIECWNAHSGLDIRGRT